MSFDLMSESLLNPLLMLLWMIWAVLLFGGLIVGVPDNERTLRMPRWMRLTSSLTLVAAAWVFAVQRSGTLHSDLALLTAIGMTLGFIGDLFMAKLIIRSDKAVFGGIGAFGLGHVVYSLVLITVANR